MTLTTFLGDGYIACRQLLAHGRFYGRFYGYGRGVGCINARSFNVMAGSIAYF
jgi:hypothetical protein